MRGQSASLRLMLAAVVAMALPLMIRAADLPNFADFQDKQLGRSLPPLPLRTKVFGSIFQTAYYFVDVNLGAPDPQPMTMIIDTGSSTQGVPCHDCEDCGHAHWDPYYNRTKSHFNEKMPCGHCSTCRLNTDEATLESMVPALSALIDTPDAFSDEAASMLLSDADRMQCLYNVHYAEGSSLSGLFYNDVVWLNVDVKPDSKIEVLTAADGDSVTCPKYPLSAGPSVPLVVPLGCHLEETHLFFDQKASGILGLEFWGTRGVPTFPTSILQGLQELYSKEGTEIVACDMNGSEGDALDEKTSGTYTNDAPEFHFSFALCLSPQGGTMSFGAANTEFHAEGHEIDLDTTKLGDNQHSAPLVAHPGKSQSYTVGLTSLRATTNATVTPAINSPEYFAVSDKPDLWTSIDLKPASKLRIADNQEVDIIPTLMDSGTTLSYLPSRLFGEILFTIENRVAVNMGLREARRASSWRRGLRKVAPTRLFDTKDRPLIVRDSLLERTSRSTGASLEFIPVKTDLVMEGPKRLVRMNTIPSNPAFRRLQEAVTEEFYRRWKGGVLINRRRLSDTPPSLYAVLEPTEDPAHATLDSLVGFLDIPAAMEGAVPRALVSKLEGYSNGECWWLQNSEKDLPLFPMLQFQFYKNMSVTWHPLSYMYSGTNEHFWCLAMMTDGGGSAGDEETDGEIIFGSNSFVYHDVIFSLESEDGGAPKTEVARPEAADNSKGAAYKVVSDAFITITPADCPEHSLEGRSRQLR